jgi:hypothetical protein
VEIKGKGEIIEKNRYLLCWRTGFSEDSRVLDARMQGCCLGASPEYFSYFVERDTGYLHHFVLHTF